MTTPLIIIIYCICCYVLNFILWKFILIPYWVDEHNNLVKKPDYIDKSQDRQWGINTTIFAPITVFLTIFFLLFALYHYLKKVLEKVF